jgi:acyl-coenzyme A thioesterase PaaI-like protein
MSRESIEQALRRWRTDDPKRVVGPGHPVGDFLEAPEWEVIERGSGTLRLRAQLPDPVKNPRGELFGGFTATYADFAALHVFHTARRPDEKPHWLTTASLQLNYFAPITGPEFEMLGKVLNRSGRTAHVQIEFFDRGGALCAIAQATLIEQRSNVE